MPGRKVLKLWREQHHFRQFQRHSCKNNSVYENTNIALKTKWCMRTWSKEVKCTFNGDRCEQQQMNERRQVQKGSYGFEVSTVLANQMFRAIWICSYLPCLGLLAVCSTASDKKCGLRVLQENCVQTTMVCFICTKIIQNQDKTQNQVWSLLGFQ